MEQNKNSLHRRTQKLQIATAAIVGVSLIVTIVGQAIIKSQREKIKEAKQQVADLTALQSNQRQFYQFLAAERQDIEKLNAVFPDKSTIINFVAAVENLLDSQGIDGTFKFGALVPTRGNDQAYVPVTITMTTTVPQFLDFLRRFEKMPFIVQPTGLSAQAPEGLADPIQANLTGRLYVQDPF